MKLKINLLISILENTPTPNKYTKAYLNLVNVHKLEKEDGFDFPENIENKILNVTSKYESFLNNIPLQVVERYYNEYKQEINKYVFLEFNEKELSEMKIIDLYLLLEDFFSEVFEVACQIANYYNLEVKLNDANKFNKNVNFA